MIKTQAGRLIEGPSEANGFFYIFKQRGRYGETHFLRSSQLGLFRPEQLPVAGFIEYRIGPSWGLPFFTRRKS